MSSEFRLVHSKRRSARKSNGTPTDEDFRKLFKDSIADEHTAPGVRDVEARVSAAMVEIQDGEFARYVGIYAIPC